MKHPRHRRAGALYLQSLLHLSAWGSGLAALILGLLATVERNTTPLLVAGGLLLFCGVAWLLHALEGNRTRCAVCSTALFGTFQCRKHRRAKTVLGSYQLLIALQVLFLRRYQCQHCNEHVFCHDHKKELPIPQTEQTVLPQSFPTLRELQNQNPSDSPVSPSKQVTPPPRLVTAKDRVEGLPV